MPKTLGGKVQILALAILEICWAWKLYTCSDAFAANTILLFALAFVGLVGRWDRRMEGGRDRKAVGVLAVLFSFSTCLANHSSVGYRLWFVILLVAGCVVGWFAISLFLGLFRKEIGRCEFKACEGGGLGLCVRWFAIPFVLICAWYCAVFFACCYPGYISEDSVSQLQQVVSNQYSNHHPYWHTMLIKVCYDLGVSLMGSPNAGVATFSLFQIVVTSAVFAYSVLTLRECGVRRRFIAVVILLYVLMPYHITYSFTMWKDVLFGVFVLLFVTATLRILNNVGVRDAANYLLFALGSLGAALLRNNGWFALVLYAIVFAVLYGRRFLAVSCILVVTLVVSFVMTHQVLSALGVAQTEVVESLSIPLQQISRVVVDGHELSPEDRAAIDKVIPIEEIPGAYNPWLSNPIKWKTNQDYVNANPVKCLLLWARLGIKYPVSYLNAWIDQTRGYWNSGYGYWIWLFPGMIDNDLGIYRDVDESLEDAWGNVLGWIRKMRVFRPFLSIGLGVWALTLLCVFYALDNERSRFLLCLLPLSVVGTLLMATPVFAEFRYAYCVFTCLPFCVALADAGKSEAASAATSL